MCWLAHILAVSSHQLNFSSTYCRYSRNTSECCTGLSLVPRAVVTVGRVVITILSAMRCYTAHFYAFWDAESESDIENFEFKKVDHTGHLKILKLQWMTKNSKFDSFNKKWVV